MSFLFKGTAGVIRNFLMSSVALVVTSGSAFAADLPSRRAPPVYVPPPIPVFSWTGAYIGGQIGYAFGRDSSGFGSMGPSGVIGGGHVGYNFAPLGGGIVVGLEGDIDGLSYSKTLTPAIYSLSHPIEGSVRGRLGFAVDRALFYATGGAAFGTFTTTYITGDVISTSRVGYTVGGGVEYAITNNWSLRGEYRYTNFGTYTDALAVGILVAHKETEQRAQFGFSYKFDTILPAPVVAKY